MWQQQAGGQLDRGVSCPAESRELRCRVPSREIAGYGTCALSPAREKHPLHDDSHWCFDVYLYQTQTYMQFLENRLHVYICAFIPY